MLRVSDEECVMENRLKKLVFLGKYTKNTAQMPGAELSSPQIEGICREGGQKLICIFKKQTKTHKSDS